MDAGAEASFCRAAKAPSGIIRLATTHQPVVTQFEIDYLLERDAGPPAGHDRWRAAVGIWDSATLPDMPSAGAASPESAMISSYGCSVRERRCSAVSRVARLAWGIPARGLTVGAEASTLAAMLGCVRHLVLIGALLAVTACGYSPTDPADTAKPNYQADLAACKVAGDKEAQRLVMSCGGALLTYPISLPIEEGQQTRKCMEAKGYSVSR